MKVKKQTQMKEGLETIKILKTNKKRKLKLKNEK